MVRPLPLAVRFSLGHLSHVRGPLRGHLGHPRSRVPGLAALTSLWFSAEVVINGSARRG